MAYVPTEWVTGDVITAVKLNKAENGIAGAYDIVYIPVTVGNDGYETTFSFADAVALVGSKYLIMHIDASSSAALADQAHYFYGLYQVQDSALYFSYIYLDDATGKLVPGAIKWSESGIVEYPAVS